MPFKLLLFRFETMQNKFIRRYEEFDPNRSLNLTFGNYYFSHIHSAFVYLKLNNKLGGKHKKRQLFIVGWST